MRAKRKFAVVTGAIVFALIQVVRPDRVNPPVDSARTIEARAQVNPQVEAILNRSCYDCHSNRTNWRWYSNIAPASWLVADDVQSGRRHVNFSDWTAYHPGEADKILSRICREVTDGGMPLWFYKPLHPSSWLSSDDVKTLCAWTAAERARLARTSAPDRR